MRRHLRHQSIAQRHRSKHPRALVCRTLLIHSAVQRGEDEAQHIWQCGRTAAQRKREANVIPLYIDAQERCRGLFGFETPRRRPLRLIHQTRQSLVSQKSPCILKLFSGEPLSAASLQADSGLELANLARINMGLTCF